MTEPAAARPGGAHTIASLGAAVRNPRSLGARLVLVLTLVGVGAALAITLLLASVITPSFNGLEANGVEAQMQRTRAALAEFAGKVESTVRDYGDWTASYDYVARPSAEFERESVSPLALSNLDVNGMAYVTRAHRVVLARWIGADRRERPELRARFLQTIGAIDPEVALGRQNATAFYQRLGNRVAAIGLARIRRSDGTGTPRGYVVMAREITPARMSALLQIDAGIELADRPSGIVARRRGRLEIAVPLTGPDGHGVAAARFIVSRDVSLLGRRMLLLTVAGSTLLLLLVLVVLRREIARLVLSPLARLESHMERVRVSGSLVPLEEETRRDEIGSLGRSFNAMLRQLKDLREQLEVQSFALGRSESAVAVMHNVRNALSPVSTIISQGVQQPPPVDPVTLSRAVGELAQGDIPEARRRKLAAFVAAATEALEAARAEQIRQLGIGKSAMAHVLEIISEQQAAAHERPSLEEVDVTAIIAQNATIARYSGGASIAFTFPAHAEWVLASRVILSQVIGNLFANAAEAIAATGRGSGSIHVSIVREGESASIRIRDDGEGFDAQTRATLFQRGFSTRKHKSGGLGLHWCANSMNAMEGGLALESEGAGKGAVAVLTLKATAALAAAA